MLCRPLEQPFEVSLTQEVRCDLSSELRRIVCWGYLALDVLCLWDPCGQGHLQRGCCVCSTRYPIVPRPYKTPQRKNTIAGSGPTLLEKCPKQFLEKAKLKNREPPRRNEERGENSEERASKAIIWKARTEARGWSEWCSHREEIRAMEMKQH